MPGLGVLPGSDGVRAFADDYLGRSFVGREDAMAALEAWRLGSGSRLLLVAPAGRGKSALVLRWVADLHAREVPVIWVPISLRYGTSAPTVVRELVLARLIARGAAPGGDWIDAVQRDPVLVVLDGLDETGDEGLVVDLRTLASVDVRIVVAARTLVDRDAGGWRTHLGWPDADLLTLDVLSRRAVASLFADPATASEAMRVSGGDPLTLEMMLGRDGSVGALDAPWPEVAIDEHLVLATLAGAVAPIRPSLLARVADVGVDVALTALADARRRLVTNPDDAVSFAHPRLGYEVHEATTPAQRAAIDGRYATVIDAEATRLLAGGAPDADTPYVLAGCLPHLKRVGAPIAALDRLIAPRWLEVWASGHTGPAGFVSHLLATWEAVDNAQAERWTDEHATLQFRYASLALLLDGSESARDPSTRAAAVRLGLRSQRAAIAGLAALTNRWEHAEAVRALLEVLDAHGFDLLLATVKTRSEAGWPVADVMLRLIDQGLEPEALLWLSAQERGETLISAASTCLEALSAEGRGIAQEAVRQALSGLDPSYHSIDSLIEGAWVLPHPDRDHWLVLGLSWLGAAAEDDALFWDDHEGSRDPRLLLAEAFAAAGNVATAKALVERVLGNPYPFADTQPAKPRSEVAQAVATCAEALDDDALRSQALTLAEGDFSALLGLVEAGVRPTSALTPFFAALGREDARSIERAARVAPSPALGRCVLALVRDCTTDLTTYANGYALQVGLLEALGSLATVLDSADQREARSLVWDRIAAEGAQTVTWWHLAHALIPLLAASPDPQTASAVLDRALAGPTESPPLCHHPAWREVWSEPDQRRYIAALLATREVSRPHDWCRLLTSFAADGTTAAQQDAARTAVDLALAHDNHGAAADAVGSAGEATWRRLATSLAKVNTPATSAAWALAKLIASAPTSADAHIVARIAWATPARTASMGCASALLAALPEPEAEVIAADLIATGTLGSVTLSALPPRARARVIAARKAKCAPGDWQARAQLVVDGQDLADPAIVEAREAVVAHLNAEIPRAVDLSHAQSAADGPWRILATMIRRLDRATLTPYLESVCARAPRDLVQSYAARLQTLGDEAGWLHVLTHATPTPGVMAMSRRLALSATLTEITTALVAEPAYATHSWVLDGIRSRGWAPEYATWAVHLEDPRAQLQIWDGLWETLDPALQRRLWPAVHAALRADLQQKSGARHRWWARLDAVEKRALWCLEHSARRARQVGGGLDLTLTPSQALGLADANAEALVAALRWIVTR